MQSAAVNCSFSYNMTSLGVTFILLAMGLRPLVLTSHIQVLQVDALGDEFEDPNIGDVNASLQVEVAQLGALASYQTESSVCELSATI